MHVQPGRRKNGGGANLQGKVISAPPGRVCTPSQSNSAIFGGNWGDLDGRSGYLGNFSLCVEGDYSNNDVIFLGEEKFTPIQASFLQLNDV